MQFHQGLCAVICFICVSSCPALFSVLMFNPVCVDQNDDEDDKADDEDPDADDWMVPHGYLSDGEGVDDEDEVMLEFVDHNLTVTGF